ncbi:stage II sporulation protein M [Actinocatenispora rupis]|uniref:Membrane protein n=1 Tax=Actinocatenispora rupis TaxID=519421 RepID=A0A8J3J5H2_9ACTN|nr:membrane protein [Actinocatenispora rupis]
MLPGVDLDAFVSEHRAEWRRLGQLARRHRPAADEVDELVLLYQRAATHLSLVRSRAPDPALVSYLSRLVLRARATITGGRSWHPRELARFCTDTFPAAVYRSWPWWVSVAVLFTAVSGGLTGYFAAHPEVLDRLIGSGTARQLADHDFAAYYSDQPAQDFAFQVWTNNALVAGMCLASGILLFPVLVVLAGNALTIGIDGGALIGQGRAAEFFGLIAPHGMLELTAVFVAAGTGLRIGWSWVAPGPYLTRGQALAGAARSGVAVALGLVGVLAVSGVIEAFVTPSRLPTAARLGIGLAALAAFLLYVVVLGSRAAARGDVGDVDEDLREAAAPVDAAR